MEQGCGIDSVSFEIRRRTRYVLSCIGPVHNAKAMFTEEVPTRRLYISAFTIGMGYLVGGIIPLLPYFFTPYAQEGLMYSCLVTGIVLLIFGAVKTHVTGAGVGTRGYLWGALSMLLVGGCAAGAAYGIVAAIEGTTGA